VFQERGYPGNIASATFTKSGNGAVTISVAISYFDDDYGVNVSGTVSGTANVSSSTLQMNASGTLSASNGMSGQCNVTFSGNLQSASGTNPAHGAAVAPAAAV
jgi:hypothetical protein